MDPFVAHFIHLVAGWNAEGWAEYLLWETLEGVRDRPFMYRDPLAPADSDVLRRLRDELKVWPFWNYKDNGWSLAPIDAWRAHTASNTAADAFLRMEAETQKRRTT